MTRRWYPSFLINGMHIIWLLSANYFSRYTEDWYRDAQSNSQGSFLSEELPKLRRWSRHPAVYPAAALAFPGSPLDFAPTRKDMPRCRAYDRTAAMLAMGRLNLARH